MRYLFALVLVVIAVCAPSRADARPIVDWTCNASTACDGWFRSNVFLDWTVAGASSVSGCADVTLTHDTPSSLQGCIAKDGTSTVDVTLELKLDKTPPTVIGAQPNRSTDLAGWYTRPVRVDFTGHDVTSGLAGCTATTYAGPDAADAVVTGACRDVAGNQSGSLGFQLRYDATPPDITGVVPERPPDHGAWYTRPVAFAVQAGDATSGLAVCPPLTYSGPDHADATVLASCTDRAGNSASRAFPLRFDATAPDAPSAKITTGDRVVRLRWPAAAAIRVVRTPGLDGKSSSVVHNGPGRGFTDRRVHNGQRYRYALTLDDEAGNRARQELSGVAGPHLVTPASRAVVTGPPLLEWTPTRGTRYYNVQLFRGGRKILSTWPRRSALRLKPHWHFGGKRYRLKAGTYRWYVWPGEGRRKENVYGPRIGRRSFTVAPSHASGAVRQRRPIGR